jgi:carboxyl-terminal processing protease
LKSLQWTLLFILIFSLASFAGEKEMNALSIFDQTTDLITKNFYDRTFRGLPWENLVKSARSKIKPTSPDDHLEAVLNQLLDKLHASHTEFLSTADQEYWALESIFSGKVDGAPLQQIGAWYVNVGGKWFIRNAFEESPAALSGLLAGDEIVSVDNQPFEPVNSFRKSSQRTFSVQIKRSQSAEIETVYVTAADESYQRSMLKGTLASYKVYEICGKKVGYFHLWAGTNDESQDALANIAHKAAQETDSFILDLRDGFGGAYPGYLNPFYDHDDQGKPTSQIYSKPMVTLINDGVRSGKEWISDILKQTHRATLIGTQTKGYFLAAKIFPVVPGRFDLYLAVAKGPGPDLEGNGVKPDIEVSFALPYSAGFDPQLERGLSFLGGVTSDGVCK